MIVEFTKTLRLAQQSRIRGARRQQGELFSSGQGVFAPPGPTVTQYKGTYPLSSSYNWMVDLRGNKAAFVIYLVTRTRDKESATKAHGT